MSNQTDDFPSMLFYAVRENIGLLNYTAKEQGWEKLNPEAKSRFSQFANLVRQLKGADDLTITDSPKGEPEEWRRWRADIFDLLKARRTYKLTSGQRSGEAKTMTWLFKQGYTKEQIIKAFDIMNSQPFWAGKSLTLMSVAKQIGAILQNEVGKLPPEPVPPRQWRTTPETKEEAVLSAKLWGVVLEYTKGQVSAPNYKTWLEDSVGLAIEGNTLVVGVKSLYVADYLGKNQQSMLKRSLCQTQDKVTDIAFTVKKAGEDNPR